MKRIQSMAASAVLILGCMPAVQGAPKQRDDNPVNEARAEFENIGQLSAAVAEQAFELRQMALSGRDPEAHLEGLEVIKEDVNRIGGELRGLEAERESLSPWQQKALDQTAPLMKEVADNATAAIGAFTANRMQVFANAYTEKAGAIQKDAHEASTLLRDYLKLAANREQDRQLEQNLRDAPQ